MYVKSDPSKCEQRIQILITTMTLFSAGRIKDCYICDGAYFTFLVIVNKWEREGDVERAVFVRMGRPLSRFERGHQVDPPGWSFHFESFDEFRTENADQQHLKLQIDACRIKFLQIIKKLIQHWPMIVFEKYARDPFWYLQHFWQSW